MLGDIRQAKNVYIVTGYTDMRKGIRSLVPYVMQNFKMDPYESGLFLFCGKKCDRLKALLWEPDGFVLLYKVVSEAYSESDGEFSNFLTNAFKIYDTTYIAATSSDGVNMVEILRLAEILDGEPVQQAAGDYTGNLKYGIEKNQYHL